MLCSTLQPHEPARLLCPRNSPGKNIGVGLVFDSPGDLPNPGIKHGSPALQADALPSEPPEGWENYDGCFYFQINQVPSNDMI